MLIEEHLIHVYRTHWLKWAPINTLVPKPGAHLLSEDIHSADESFDRTPSILLSLAEGAPFDAKIVGQTDRSWIVYRARASGKQIHQRYRYAPKEAWIVKEHPVLDEPHDIL